jgi:LPXTG-motif cell wall-anchored protein
MNKKTNANTPMIIIGIALIAGGIYLFTRNKKNIYALTIVKAGKSFNYPTLMTFDEEYLKAWANAIKSKSDVFVLNGKNYSTQGGVAV